MIFLSSHQLPLLSSLFLALSLSLSLPPSLVHFLTLSLLHGDSDTAEMLHLNEISDESHTSRTLSISEKFIFCKETHWQAVTSDWHFHPLKLEQVWLNRQRAAMIDVSNVAYFSPLHLRSWLNKQAGFNGAPFTLLWPLLHNKCVHTHINTK